MDLIWVVPIAGLASVLFASYFAWDVLRRDRGTERMQEVAGMIYEGAVAFLNRQYRTIGSVAIIAAVIITLLIGLFEQFSETEITGFDLGIRTGIAFLVGAAASALSGIIGMYVAVKSNLQVAAASRRGVGEALFVALRGGAVSGFLVVSLSLLGVFAMFLLYDGFAHPEQAPFLIVGMGFGASFVALFAQLGGGIYTKAADVGADLVGKVEAGIPEDDPRNPAVVADLVGDNVGDCAGRGADLFESTVAENIGAMILGVAIYLITQNPAWIFFPLVVRAFGLISSLVGVFFVRHRKGEEPMDALNRGYYIALALSAVFLYITTQTMLGSIWFFYAGLIGLATSLAFVYITMYYTEARFRPVKAIAEATKTGTATNFLSGIAMAFENTAPVALTVGVALIASFWTGSQWALETGLVDAARGGIFGTAVATMGMLMTAAYILAMDTFGPIVDNAGGIVEMSASPPEVRAGIDALDATGNTTKALTKGYAIGSAALAAFLLFSAYLDKVALVREAMGLSPEAVENSRVVDLGRVEIFVGATLGVMLIFLFSSLAIQAVSKTASEIIREVRRQFKEIPGIMEGTARPDFARCVDITTRGALRNMVVPGILPVLGPLAVGLIFKSLGVGAETVAAFLMAGTMAGILLASVMNNGGAAWDNAKKWIEAGGLLDAQGNVIGKGSEVHAASVVGDTVGDPLKDTAGPSLHVVIKLLSTITLVLAPLFI
ncbi:MAG: sodium-translocating pyrophosphatase [Chloroflexi bacterium]|nr:sodium-translocating pyrophosphatase [Chloroflexota bacterium]